MIKMAQRTQIIVFIALIVFVMCGKAKAENDPYPDLEIPVFVNGYDVKEFMDESKKVKSTVYSLEVKYPASEVIEFYKSRLKEMGFSLSPSFVGDFNKNGWDCFIAEEENSIKVCQLLSLWANLELKEEIFLVLLYEKKGKDWKEQLRVSCQIQPLIDTKKIDNFFEKLKASGQYVRFMELLDRYRMSTGEVDLEKAITENPDKNLLKVYKKIIDGIQNSGAKNSRYEPRSGQNK